MFWISFLLLVLIVVAVYGAANASGTSTSAARRILDERLATGELTTEDHASRAAELAEQSGPRLPWPAIVLGLALLALLGAFLWWNSDEMMGLGWRDGRGGMMNGSGMMDGDGMMGGRGMMGDHMAGTNRSGTAEAPVAGAKEIEVRATELRFDPVTMSSTVGEPVNLTLINDGAVLHDLVIESLGFTISAEPGERVTGGLTIEDPGTYEFICTVPDHATAGMRGTLKVSPARLR